MNTHFTLDKLCSDYSNKLSDLLRSSDWSKVDQLGKDMHECWLKRRQVFLWQWW